MLTSQTSYWPGWKTILACGWLQFMVPFQPIHILLLIHCEYQKQNKCSDEQDLPQTEHLVLWQATVCWCHSNCWWLFVIGLGHRWVFWLTIYPGIYFLLSQSSSKKIKNMNANVMQKFIEWFFFIEIWLLTGDNRFSYGSVPTSITAFIFQMVTVRPQWCIMGSVGGSVRVFIVLHAVQFLRSKIKWT